MLSDARYTARKTGEAMAEAEDAERRHWKEAPSSEEYLEPNQRHSVWHTREITWRKIVSCSSI